MKTTGKLFAVACLLAALATAAFARSGSPANAARSAQTRSVAFSKGLRQAC